MKSKYNILIKANELSEKDSLKKSLANTASNICKNDVEIEFLEKIISKSSIINKSIKHIIYLEFIKYYKEKNNGLKKLLSCNYSRLLKPENSYECIDFLINLTEEDANGFIEYLDDKYINIEKEFFSQKKV